MIMDSMSSMSMVGKIINNVALLNWKSKLKEEVHQLAVIAKISKIQTSKKRVFSDQKMTKARGRRPPR